MGEVLEKMNDFGITTVAVTDEDRPSILLATPIRKFSTTRMSGSM
jgi:hypothetical protein